MIEAGRVYIALPPLYRLQRGRGDHTTIQYAWTNEELTKLTSHGHGGSLQRFKGLGEMNADQLWQTTMNPASRTLIRVRIEDAAEAEKRITTLMGDKVAPRRKWIDSHVQFTLNDEESDQLVENKGKLQKKRQSSAKQSHPQSGGKDLTAESNGQLDLDL